MNDKNKAMNEIPWPADPATLPRDEHGRIVVGRYFVCKAYGEGRWLYGERGSEDTIEGGFLSAYDAVNEGALRDDYRGEEA
jgi:hypothetical protein